MHIFSQIDGTFFLAVNLVSSTFYDYWIIMRHGDPWVMV